MGITPDNNSDMRPGLSQSFDNALQNHDNLFPRRTLTCSQDRCNQFAAFPLINVKRQVTVTAMIGIEKRQLLAAMSGIVVPTNRDREQYLLEAFYKSL